MSGEVTMTSTWGIDLTRGGKRVGLLFERERTTATGRKGKPERLGTIYAEPGEGWPELLRSLATLIEQGDGSLHDVATKLAEMRAAERAS